MYALMNMFWTNAGKSDLLFAESISSITTGIWKNWGKVNKVHLWFIEEPLYDYKLSLNS